MVGLGVPGSNRYTQNQPFGFSLVFPLHISFDETKLSFNFLKVGISVMSMDAKPERKTVIDAPKTIINRDSQD